MQKRFPLLPLNFQPHALKPHPPFPIVQLKRMSHKELQEDLTHLRIRYGTTNVYKTLMKQMREEYEELSSLFGVSSGNPTSTFYPTSSTEFYKEYMEMAAQAAHDTLEEHPVLSSAFYDEETTSLDAQSIHGDEFSLSPEEDADGMDLITQLYNDISSRVECEPPVDDSENTPPEAPLKIIQTCGASAASEAPSKRKLLKKAAVETVEVVKETETTAPAKPKKNSKKTQ
jgi:hypothetical protein